LGLIVAGSPFKLVIQAQDPYGNVSPAFNGAVGVTLTNTPDGPTAGRRIVTAVNGIATFNNLTFDTVGSVSILAIRHGLTPWRSPPFDVMRGQLVIAKQPPLTVADGTRFGIAARLEDAAGKLLTAYSGRVLAVLNDPSGESALEGKTFATLANGTVAFANLIVDQSGANALSRWHKRVIAGTTDEQRRSFLARNTA
jgi:hypothetical protein